MGRKKNKKPHPGPPKHGGEQHQCNSGGNTHIRGEVEMSLAPSLIAKYDTEREADDSREDIKRIVSILTLLGVFLAAGFSAWQACSANKSAEQAVVSNGISRDSLQSVQRAFILMGAIDSVIPDAKDTRNIKFLVRWNNFGATPGRGTLHVNFRWNTMPLPDNFTFPDLWGEGDPKIATPFVIGPKGETGIVIGPIPTEVVRGVVAKTYHLNVWGWAKYRDVFKDTPEHLTEFCSELVPYEMRPATKPNTTEVNLRADNCPRHNCYDDDCKVEK